MRIEPRKLFNPHELAQITGKKSGNLPAQEISVSRFPIAPSVWLKESRAIRKLNKKQSWARFLRWFEPSFDLQTIGYHIPVPAELLPELMDKPNSTVFGLAWTKPRSLSTWPCSKRKPVWDTFFDQINKSGLDWNREGNQVHIKNRRDQQANLGHEVRGALLWKCWSGMRKQIKFSPNLTPGKQRSLIYPITKKVKNHRKFEWKNPGNQCNQFAAEQG